MALRASLNGKHVCTLFPTGFEQKFTKFILLGIMKVFYTLSHKTLLCLQGNYDSSTVDLTVGFLDSYT